MKTMKYICVCLLTVQIFITHELTYAGKLDQEVTDTVTEKDKTLSVHESENTNNQLEITFEESETIYNNVNGQDNKQNSIYYQKKSNTEEALMLNEQEFDVSNSEKKVQSLTGIGIGSLGTSNWYIDSFGTLHIESGVFPDSVAMNNNNSPFYTYHSQIESIIFEGPVTAGASLSWLFSGLDQVKSINNLSYLDTSQTTDMSRMFHGMRSLDLLDLLGLNTENVTNMFMMFADMKNLTSINVSSFNTEKVTNMNNMFQNTSKLKSLNLSSFYTDNLLSMDSMFMWSGLNELDISNFDTTNSTLNRDTFYGVPLKKIKLSKNFLFKESLLNSPASSENYTGKWQNIGHGTESNPLGNNVWTSEELQINYDGTVGVDTYVWQPVRYKAKDLAVNYQDAEGNKIADSQIVSGNIGDSYDVSGEEYKLKIAGYTFQEVKGEVTGILTDKEQSVTYIYTKNPVKAKDLTVNYQDVEGNKVADSQTVSGNIGDSYDVSKEEYKLEIAGYTFKEVKGEVTGILTDKEQSVTYVYTKNPVKAKDLTVNYQDAEGNKIADSQIVSGNISDSYDVSGEEYKLEIAGYTFKEVKGEVTGGLTDKEQTVTYIYISEATKVKNKETSYSTEEKNEDQVQGSGNKYNTRKATLLPKTGEKQTFYLSLRGILLFFSGLIVMYWRFKIKE
ncbi:MucBP domain-containing protein [Listeria monocytogenes]|uniref:MucBP domain-containing protein n=2 Tax=Listeria monocytogenes TaxID=1639 RepID=UPI001F0D30A2|nr:MucBP domain-containing protein [Listeria monocytogenes]MCH5002095.1 MucBP domain-containing protein [Listeria monocytogenes]